MHIIYRRQNYRNIRLEAGTENETVGVVTRAGGTQQIRWLGFISREDARRSGGRPVKLLISRVEREDLQPGRFVQGCLMAEGVYAVTDTTVAIIGDGKMLADNR